MKSDFSNFDLYQVPIESPLTINIDEKDVLVIVSADDFNTNKELLEKIIKAIPGINEDLVVTYEINEDDHLKIANITRDQFAHVILFGINPKRIGMNLKISGYRFYRTETFSLLLCHKLSKISTEKKYKKALWDALLAEFQPN